VNEWYLLKAKFHYAS